MQIYRCMPSKENNYLEQVLGQPPQTCAECTVYIMIPPNLWFKKSQKCIFSYLLLFKTTKDTFFFLLLYLNEKFKFHKYLKYYLIWPEKKSIFEFELYWKIYVRYGKIVFVFDLFFSFWISPLLFLIMIFHS